MVHQLLIQGVVEFDTLNGLLSQLKQKVLFEVQALLKVAAAPLPKHSVPLLMLFESDSSPLDILLRSYFHVDIRVVIQGVNNHLQVFVVVLEDLFDCVLVVQNELIKIILSLNQFLLGQLLIICEVEWLSVSVNVCRPDVGLFFMLCVATEVSVLATLFISRLLSLGLVSSTCRSSLYQFSMLPLALHKAALIYEQLTVSVSHQIVELTSVDFIGVRPLFSSLD